MDPQMNRLRDIAHFVLRSPLTREVLVYYYEELQHRIEGACQQIRNEQGVFERIRNSMRRRVQCCVQMQGQHFEHL
jgi:hypothetical protein